MLAINVLAAVLMSQTPHTFSHDKTGFLLDGKPFVVISGEMHYLRVPRIYWRDRMKKARAMGLNTICTYVFWNAHESKPGRFDFSGNLDLKAYIQTAQEEGLFVIVRPGPYVCTEWDLGGIPAWLLKDPKTVIRTMDPTYLAAADRYLKRVGQEIKPMLVKNGGPVIMAQVENEYGSFGSDHTYMAWVRDTMKTAGFDCTLFTSDGPGENMLKGGTLPDCLSVVNFGGGAESAFKEFDKFRQDVPRMCGEYWCGWFDHWGKDHATTGAEGHVKDIDYMLGNGISMNFYMFHGGTNFGFMAGANGGKNEYNCDVTSYDYDAPLDEAGRPTKKFFAFREAIQRHVKTKLPDLPAEPGTIEIGRFPVDPVATLFDSLPRPATKPQPVPMEALDQSYGFTLYETSVSGPAKGTLKLASLRDMATVFVNGKLAGTIERRLKQDSIEITIPDGIGQLRILVENQGRVNFGRDFGLERKGISGASLDGKELSGWKIYPLPFERGPRPKKSDDSASLPTFFTGSFNLNTVGDTFLDMRGWNKGLVWVNGNNLGRFWRIGAQQSLFLPASFLRRGNNDVVALEIYPDGARSIVGRKEPVYERPR